MLLMIMTLVVAACASDDDDNDVNPAPPPRPPSATQDPNLFPNDIALFNNSDKPIAVRILFHGDGALIDQRMLRDKSIIRSINAAHVTPSDQAPVIEIPVNESRILTTGAFTEVDFDTGTATPRRSTRGVAVDVEGQQTLLVGNGTATFQRLGPDSTSLSMTSNTLLSVPLIRRDPTQCSGRGANLRLPKRIEPEHFGKVFVVSSPKLLPRDTTTLGTDPDCYGITAKLNDDATQTLDFEVCNGSTTFWPFKENDVVTLERPKTIERARVNGMRLTRPTDGVAIELAHVVEPESRIFHQPTTDRIFARDTNDPPISCFIAPQEASCLMESIRLNVIGEANIEIEPTATVPFQPRGQAFLLGARRSLYSLNCAADFGVTFDVVVVEE
jgi:hypothetical protein